MRVVRGALLAMIALVMLGEATYAQSISSPYRFVDRSQAVGAFAGYVLTSRGSVGLGPEDGPVFGVRYGIRLSGPFNVEGEIGYFPTTRPVQDTLLAPGDSTIRQIGEADLTLLVAMASLRFNLTGPRTWHGIQPFVAFGVGAAADLSGTSAFEEAEVEPDVRFEFGTSFAGYFGGGLEWFASDRLTFRVDARNLLWNVDTPLPLLNPVFDPTTPGDEWLQNAFFTVGVSLRF